MSNVTQTAMNDKELVFADLYIDKDVTEIWTIMGFPWSS